MDREISMESDLADECIGERGGEIPGAVFSKHADGALVVGRLCISTEEAAKRIGKPLGNYVTLHCGRMDRLSEAEYLRVRLALADEISDMATRLCQGSPCHRLNVLVAGLGNAELTADAIGPAVAAELTATRQLQMLEKSVFEQLGCAALSVISPGVLGQTGIESAELLRGAVDIVSPDALIVVDALAARSCERLASTVQLSDSGISPGSGVGNHRQAIDRSTMGVPVIAIGIPMVVDSATLVYDALRSAGIERTDERLKNVLETGKSFFVSPKESDLICKRGASLLAEAITEAFCASLFQDSVG